MGIPNLSALVLVKNDQYWLRYALESTRELFDNYVFYDVQSEDQTREIIEGFISTLPDTVTVMKRFLPMCPPSVQGCFRNSMIVESRSEWYFILDGDEIYSEQSVNAIKDGFSALVDLHDRDPQKIYGVLKRVEVGNDLKSCYSDVRPHHRVYHKSAFWYGNHPGEIPYYEQNDRTNFNFPNEAVCYHFHNTARSPEDASALKRLERRNRGTYQPGELIPFDLFKTLPILAKKFDNIRLNPLLEKMQNAKM